MERRTSRIGLPWWAIGGLAALGAPRVVLHDLDVIGGGDFDVASVVLTIVPVGVWIAVLIVRRVEHPLFTGAVIGATYGVILAAIHQALWNEAFEDDPPRLGGNLEGELSPGWEEAVLRLAAIPSSIAVGTALGLIAGAVARLVLGRRP